MQRHVERDSAALARHRENLSSYVSDVDAARAAHQFLWTNEDDGALSSEQRLAKEHHERLHREYAVGDFTRYKDDFYLGNLTPEKRKAMELSIDALRLFASEGSHCRRRMILEFFKESPRLGAVPDVRQLRHGSQAPGRHGA